MSTRKDFLLQILPKMGEFQMQYFGKEVEYEAKSNHMDLVSFVDIESQKMFTDALLNLYPDDVVMGEEGYNPNFDYKNNEHCWIIDPVDGTLLFKRGIPFFGIMIAYVESSTVRLSAIYLPALGELYFADETGSYFDNAQIKVSTTEPLSHAVINYPSYSLPLCFADGKGYFDFLKKIGQCLDYYSMALAGPLCASGKIDGGIFYPTFGNVWDTIPGAYLIQQAGGKVTTVGSDSWDIWNNKMIYTNGKIHNELEEALIVKY